MSVQNAKIFGMLALILGLTVYCLLAVTLAGAILPDNWFIEMLFYVVAGVLWVVPARWLIIRINRE
jgi:hypothetical protein